MQSPDASPAGRSAKLALPALIIGGVLIGCSPIFVRLSEVGSVSTAFWRLALALVPLLLIARGDKVGARPVTWADRVTVALPGIILGAELVAWHISLHMTSVANSTLLVNMAPVFVVLISWMFLGRRPGGLIVLAGILIARKAQN